MIACFYLPNHLRVEKSSTLSNQPSRFSVDRACACTSSTQGAIAVRRRAAVGGRKRVCTVPAQSFLGMRLLPEMPAFWAPHFFASPSLPPLSSHHPPRILPFQGREGGGRGRLLKKDVSGRRREKKSRTQPREKKSRKQDRGRRSRKKRNGIFFTSGGMRQGRDWGHLEL